MLMPGSKRRTTSASSSAGEDALSQPRRALARRSFLAASASGVAALTTALALPESASALSVRASASGGADELRQWKKDLPASLQKVLDSWARSPSTHPLMGDWRRVGYRRGVVEPKGKGSVVKASSVGIHPDQPDDVSVALQAEVDKLGERGGGVLVLDAGRYVLDSPLFVHYPNVVVRGQGKHQTTLYFTRPLAQSVRPGTFWSWTGGQVFFVSRERLASRAGEGFLAGDPIATVSPAARGATVLTVSTTEGLKPDQMVMLEIEGTPTNDLAHEVGGNVAGAFTYDWSSTPELNGANWQWPVVITDIVSKTKVRIEQPLRLTIPPQNVTTIRPLLPTVHDSGVEGLTIENKLITQTVHNQNPGSNGVCFQAAYDCWAKDIHVLNVDVAYGMTAAKSCTLTGISAGGRAMHHFTISRAGSHDNLIEDFVLEDFTIPLVPGAYTHGISVENLGSGNVWRRGRMDIGTFDSHRAMPFENLRTDIQLVNKIGVPGGAFNAGPCYGTRFVHWGITVTTDNNLCMGITDVAPKSMTAGITGLTNDGSELRQIPPIQSAPYFDGDLQSTSYAFGTNLGNARDLLEIQRSVPL
jgi:hypothetical protein